MRYQQQEVPMLVLTRHKNEQIRIGDDIIVRVCDVNRGQVKIGIDAPPHVTVHREEIYQRVKEAQS